MTSPCLGSLSSTIHAVFVGSLSCGCCMSVPGKKACAEPSCAEGKTGKGSPSVPSMRMHVEFNSDCGWSTSPLRRHAADIMLAAYHASLIQRASSVTSILLRDSGSLTECSFSKHLDTYFPNTSPAMGSLRSMARKPAQRRLQSLRKSLPEILC